METEFSIKYYENGEVMSVLNLIRGTNKLGIGRSYEYYSNGKLKSIIDVFEVDNKTLVPNKIIFCFYDQNGNLTQENIQLEYFDEHIIIFPN